MELKLSGTHQMLVSADDVNLLRDNTDTITKEKTKCRMMSHHQDKIIT
jgi:hypothetical protein